MHSDDQTGVGVSVLFSDERARRKHARSPTFMDRSLPARGGIWSSRTQSTQVPESHLVPLVEFLYCQPNPKFFFNYRDGKFGVFGLNNTPNNERPNDGLASRNHLWSFIVHGNALLKQKALQ